MKNYNSTSNIDPHIHKMFKECCRSKNGTIYGAYTLELPMALEWVIGVMERKLKLKELVPPPAVVLPIYRNGETTSIRRKNRLMELIERNEYKSNVIVLNKIQKGVKDKYGTQYGEIASLVNQAMELYVKVEKGYVKLIRR